MSDAVARAHCFQHVPYEGLGAIEPWLESAGCAVSSTRFFAGETPPALHDVDLLVVMGGPMSVNDEEELPWLADEKRFIRSAIDAGRKVLGVCLGAQLIAAALGTRVYPHHTREIGWFPISATPQASSSPFPLPEKAEAFHWHGDTFDLPDGAVHLASSEACEHQAFCVGDSVLGLQCHLEMTPAIAGELIRHSGHQLIPSDSIQSRDALLAAGPERYRPANVLMEDLLVRLTGLRSSARTRRS